MSTPIETVHVSPHATCGVMMHRLAEEALIVTLRATNADDALWVSRIFLDAGLKVVEVTYTVPQAELVIQELSREFPDAVIGAGTVLDVRTAVGALSAGAQFIVSPI